eukprot:TRINITY_DN14655_c0_g1_i1.p1 TRINITY_DN14655_c0_g1~~TRINITY_DN14655_c0_g1_i1.p1  ORF type:complete len:335 (+),score=43.24 TRINITY_DN14655_c0_g1_i1:142-1146(+)
MGYGGGSTIALFLFFVCVVYHTTIISGTQSVPACNQQLPVRRDNNSTSNCNNTIINGTESNSLSFSMSLSQTASASESSTLSTSSTYRSIPTPFANTSISPTQTQASFVYSPTSPAITSSASIPSPRASPLLNTLELPPGGVISSSLIHNLTQKLDKLIVKGDVTFEDDLELDDVDLQFTISTLSKTPTIYGRKSIYIHGGNLIVTLTTPLTSPQTFTLFNLNVPTSIQKRDDSNQTQTLSLTFDQIQIQDQANPNCPPNSQAQTQQRSFSVLLSPQSCNQGSGDGSQRTKIGLAVGLTVGIVILLVIVVIVVAIVATVIINRKTRYSRGVVNV